MSKKTFTLIIVIILAIFGGVFWYLFGNSGATGTNGEPTSGGSELFPFGNGGTTTPVATPDTESGTTTIDLTGDGQTPPPRLRQVTLVPTAGATIFDTASSTFIRYIERATGHIYETESENSHVNKISNLTIPKIYEALWTTDGTKLLIRYLKDDNQTQRTFYAKISTTTRPEQALEGLFLADGIKDISLFGNKIFYSFPGTSGIQGIRANIDGSDKNAVFSSSFSDWSSYWTSTTSITLFSRPSGLAEGSAYTLNPQTGSYTKTIGDIKGLTALGSPDGTLVLLSKSTTGSLATGVYAVKTAQSQALAVSTLTDKCVWSVREKGVVFCGVPQTIPNGLYPDSWYQGKVSFNDSLWKIDTITGETEQLFTPEFEAGVSMDMIKLSLNQKENALIFTNKKDMTVWRYTLK